MANETDRNDAAGIAQIVRTGWFRQVHVRSEASYVVRARLAARTTLVRQRCEVDNQIRGLLKTFGILIGKAPGGLKKRAAEIAGDELAHQPELAQLVRMLLALRETLCDQIASTARHGGTYGRPRTPLRATRVLAPGDDPGPGREARTFPKNLSGSRE